MAPRSVAWHDTIDGMRRLSPIGSNSVLRHVILQLILQYVIQITQLITADKGVHAKTQWHDAKDGLLLVVMHADQTVYESYVGFLID